MHFSPCSSSLLSFICIVKRHNRKICESKRRRANTKSSHEIILIYTLKHGYDWCVRIVWHSMKYLWNYYKRNGREKTRAECWLNEKRVSTSRTMRVRYLEYDGMAWHGSQQPALTGVIVVYQSHPHFKPMAQTVQRIEKSSGSVGGMHLSFSKQSKKS